MSNNSSGPSIFDVTGGKYLRAADVEDKAPMPVTVENAYIERVEYEGKAEDKGVVKWKELKKPMIFKLLPCRKLSLPCRKVRLFST